jgi:hypothetical protein
VFRRVDICRTQEGDKKLLPAKNIKRQKAGMIIVSIVA